MGTGAQAQGSCMGFSSPHLTSPCLCPRLAPPCPEPEQGKVSLALNGRVPRQVGVLGHLRRTAELTLAMEKWVSMRKTGRDRPVVDLDPAGGVWGRKQFGTGGSRTG